MDTSEGFHRRRKEAIQELSIEDMDGFFTAVIRDSDPSQWEFRYTHGYNTDDPEEISNLDEQMLASVLVAYSNESGLSVSEVAQRGVDRAEHLQDERM